jgi:nucleoid-associated protein YgaU
MFDPTSRYYAIGTALYIAPDGSACPYVLRRLLPQPAGAGPQQVRVGHTDRLDLIAGQVLGDPLQFWRIADANAVLNPFDLARPGTTLAVPGVRFGGEPTS